MCLHLRLVQRFQKITRGFLFKPNSAQPNPPCLTVLKFYPEKGFNPNFWPCLKQACTIPDRFLWSLCLHSLSSPTEATFSGKRGVPAAQHYWYNSVLFPNWPQLPASYKKYTAVKALHIWPKLIVHPLPSSLPSLCPVPSTHVNPPTKPCNYYASSRAETLSDPHMRPPYHYAFCPVHLKCLIIVLTDWPKTKRP